MISVPLTVFHKGFMTQGTSQTFIAFFRVAYAFGEAPQICSCGHPDTMSLTFFRIAYLFGSAREVHLLKNSNGK